MTDHFCTLCLREVPSFSLWRDLLQTPRHTPALKVCASSGKKRSFKAPRKRGIREGRGRWGGAKKEDKRAREKSGQVNERNNLGCGFFCLHLEASCLQLSFLLTVVFGSLFAYNLSLFDLLFELFCLQLSFFADGQKVCLGSTSADCELLSKEAQL